MRQGTCSIVPFAAHAGGQIEAALWLIVAVASLVIGLPGLIFFQT
ncbi:MULTISPECIES: hypothetical protein [Sporomusa]